MTSCLKCLEAGGGGRIFSENGRLEIFPVNGRFPAKKGGLESLGSPRPLSATDQRLGKALQKEKKLQNFNFMAESRNRIYKQRNSDYEIMSDDSCDDVTCNQG